MDNLQNPQFKFIQALITALRQVSIYPANHPSIVNSIKSVLSSLNLIFIEKDKFNVNLSPDKVLSLEGKAVSGKNAPSAGEFIALLVQLGMEDLSFLKGINEQELAAFIQLIVSSPEGGLKSADLNKLLAGKGIVHIVVKQFSYLKVEKGKEPLLGEGGGVAGLKSRVKDYCQGNLGAADKQALEKDLFAAIADETKSKGKPSALSRDLLKKFLSREPQPDEVIAGLRRVLAECGIPLETVEQAVAKLFEEPAARMRRKPGADEEGLAEENHALRRQVEALQRRLEEQGFLLAGAKREGEKAVEDKHRIDNIIHNLAEGMVVVDAEGKILLANPAAESLLGITSQDVGKPMQQVVREEHLLTMARSLAAEMEGAAQKDIEFVCSNEETKKVLRASSAVVEDSNGNTVGMVTMLNDITRQKELEEMKSSFLANVSHELRTPLVALEKSISLMLSKEAGSVSETQQQFLSIADRNLKRLTLLINDLLDLSKCEAGKMELNFERTDPEKLINETVATMETWAQTKKLKIERQVTADLPVVRADPNRLTQVLINIIGNAVKFTPPGGKIIVSACPQETELKITVEDTGTGIAPGELEKIFQKFYRARERAGSDISGTGIGLAIVREIVNLHGGRVWAESDGVNGARFIFTLKRWSEGG